MKEWKFRSAGILGQGMLAGLFTTVRVTRVGDDSYQALLSEDRNFICAFWHGVLLPLTYYHQGEGFVVLVSEHDDGEYITRVLHRYGYETVRGSSTRGGTRGLRGIVRAARAGKSVAVTPDGPRGPERVFKPGALVAAQLTGLPILPVGVGVSSGWHFNSWDRFVIPKPLSRVRIHYGEPVDVPARLDEDEMAAWSRRLGAELNRLEGEAQAAVDGEGAG